MNLPSERSGKIVAKYHSPSNILAEQLVTLAHELGRDTNVDLLHSCPKRLLLDKLEELEILKDRNRPVFKFVTNIMHDRSPITHLFVHNDSPA